jgi:phosphohistidine phosphatase
VLSSTAKRARQTARKAIQAAGFTTPVELVHELYLASPSTCIDLLQRLPDGVDCALLVGHNPGLEELLLQITGQEEPLCTAALAHVHLFIDQWRELSANTRGTLQTVWRPKS